MRSEDRNGDVRAIEAIVARQFGSLNWAPGGWADWDTFKADFLAGASLYPAARPPTRQSVEAFVERMQSLSVTRLRSFSEVPLGREIHVFGNVAVAVAACEFIENDAETARGVEMLLLVKDGDRWQIAAQAWDVETASKRVPAHLLRAS
jgi:hypothetical protein